MRAGIAAARESVLLCLFALLVPTQANPCSWAEGYFYQVSALRGNVVGAKIGPLQYSRRLRQSFARKNATLTLYQYRRPIKQREEMPLVKTTKTDADGRFDFGEVVPGHYTLIIDDSDWGSSNWFDVEVKQQAKQTATITIDVSPNFPDCKGGHEFIVRTTEADTPASAATSVLLFPFALVLYAGIPALMVWGWARWFGRTQPRTLPAILSLIGFALATASGLLAVSSVVYAHVIGGFPYYDPRLLRIYAWGGVLSLSGIVFGIAGIWRPGPLRWHAPACSLGTLLFWFVSAMGE